MKFIVFEGLDGSGKSSLMSALEAELSHRQVAFYKTREPGGTPLGDELRNIILRKADAAPTPRTELLLYEASRAQHVDQVIRPMLAQGRWVLSDRFAASSIAFQAGGRTIALKDVEMLNHFATGGLVPDLTILMDLSTEEAKKRRHGRESGGQAEDRIEAESDAFHQRVREGFLSQAKANPSQWLVLDASLSREKLAELMFAELRRRKWLES